jgi:hypothetical protein
MFTVRIQVMLAGAEEIFPHLMLEMLLGSCPTNIFLNLSESHVYALEINNFKFS